MENQPLDGEGEVIKLFRAATNDAFTTGNPTYICHVGRPDSGVSVIAIPAMIEGETYKVEKGSLIRVI